MSFDSAAFTERIRQQELVIALSLWVFVDAHRDRCWRQSLTYSIWRDLCTPSRAAPLFTISSGYQQWPPGIRQSASWNRLVSGCGYAGLSQLLTIFLAAYQ
jgi:hypothetical protein